MTDEEKAEDYVKTNHSHLMSGTMKSIYKKIYLDGLAEGRKDKCVLEQRNDGTIKLCDVAKENEELEEKLKGFENGDVAWQGDMDKTIKQNIELKKQIEKMKCCGNCKHCYSWEDFHINMECGLPNTNIDLGNKCDKWEPAE